MPENHDGALDQPTLDALLDSLGGDTEFMAELIDTYVGDAPVQVDGLKAGLAAGEAEAIMGHAHTLKSSSASLGALELAERCRQLESSARSGRLDGAAAAIAAIETELQRVIAALEARKATISA
jgi:HPt (histidine-containing phosphotransfer) domain-containing protein